MSTTVTYKDNTLTTVSNATKTLKTAGKYMEDDITLVDDSKPTYTDVENSAGGRTITINDGIITTNSKTVWLVPTKIYSNLGNVTVLNESNMFTNTDSETYATLTQSSTAWNLIYVSGFDFTQIPTGALVSSINVIYKLATETTTAMNSTTTFKNKTDEASDSFTIRYPPSSEGVYISKRKVDGITLAQMREYGDDLNLPIHVFGNDDTYVYGIEIEVTYDLPVNKTVYGTTVLVDLTTDTVTPNDLSEGITAHDKSGGLITGTNQRGIMVIRDSSDSHGGTVRTITSGEAQVGGMMETDLRYYIQRSSGFTDIDWPDGLTAIGSHAFAGCRQFNPSSIPDGITEIGEYAFYNCSSLNLDSLPDTIRSIGQYAFYYCSLLTCTKLPAGLDGRTIPYYAFSQCHHLAPTKLPKVTAIAGYAFQHCHALALTELPEELTVINASAFSYCVGLTSISCEGAITTLGANAFTGGSEWPMALTSASFPNMALTSNLSYAFGSSTAANACQLLEFCDIGSTVGIATNAFANCYALQTLVLRKSDSICTLSNVSAFTNTPMSGYNSLTGTVYVPQALISTYQTATNWSTLYNNGTVIFAAIEGSEYERD